MKFHLISLGCQMNISDSERVKTMLIAMGFVETDEPSKADLLGIMACSVRQKAIDKIYSLIHRWNTWKQSRSLITFVSGCILPIDREKFLKRFDLLFSINELPQLPEMLKQYGVQTGFSINAVQNDGFAQAGLSENAMQNTSSVAVYAGQTSSTSAKGDATNGTTQDSTAGQANPAFTIQQVAKKHSTAVKSPSKPLPTRKVVTKPSASILSSDTKHDLARGFWQIAPSYSSAYEAFVTIQNGCDKFCTFCAVPYTRGREVSRASSEILQEVHTLMQQGFKTITLLGQNVNSYGLDTDGKEMSFADLLARIGNMAEEFSHDCWVYFTSPHPRDMTREVIRTVAKYPALAKQIHLPLQSGDDKLLLKMNRQHSLAKYRQIVEDIKTYIPEATLFTDVIVGFCGESEAQFANTAAAMEEFNYNMAYIALYSPRPGAASARWKDDIAQDTKKARYRILSDILKETASSYNKHLVGKRTKILVGSIITSSKKEVQGQNNPQYILNGRTEGKIPTRITLSQTLLNDPSFQNFLQLVVGNFIYAKITGTHSLSLECQLDAIPEALQSYTVSSSILRSASTPPSNKPVSSSPILHTPKLMLEPKGVNG